jgi:alternate signal-mediated exported protein
MKKSTKGALAAGAAASILLGGAGSLAYWTDTATVTGTAITAGHLKLTNGSCAGWKLDDGALLAAGDKIVPGEVLTQKCTYTVDAAGKHIKASFNVSSPTWASATGLSNELTTAATYKVGTATVTGATPVVNGDVITADVTVTFDGAAATNGSQDLGATLNDITVTATQSH